MNRPPKRPKGPTQVAPPRFGTSGAKGDQDSLRAAMAFRLHGKPATRKRKPTR